MCVCKGKLRALKAIQCETHADKFWKRKEQEGIGDEVAIFFLFIRFRKIYLKASELTFFFHPDRRWFEEIRSPVGTHEAQSGRVEGQDLLRREKKKRSQLLRQCANEWEI